MLNTELLINYVEKKLSLGIKGKELSKEFNSLCVELGCRRKAYKQLATKIVNNISNIEELYNTLYEKSYSNRLKNNEDVLANSFENEVHQTLAKLVADFNSKQIEFLLSDDLPINILCGSVRSGKTWVACFKFGIRVLNSDRDAKFMMVGSTLKSLESNCFKYFKLFFGNNFSYTLSLKKAVLFGREIRLEGAPNERAVEKITGDTLAGAFVDEIQIIPQSFVMQLWARCSDGNGFLYGTCNPKHPQHWLYKDWINGKNMLNMVRTWTFLVSDNKFLPKKYIESLKVLFTGVFYERNVLGKWVAAEGVVFSNFANNHDKYVINSINTDELGYACAGLDFGGNKSGSALVITGFYKDINKGIVVLHSDKLKKDKGEIDPTMLEDWVIKNIKEFQSKYTNIRIVGLNCDSAEQYLEVGVRNAIRRNGMNIPTGDALKKEIVDRIKFVQKMFAMNTLHIMCDCKTVIDSLDELVWDEKKLKDSLLDDGTTDNDTWDGFSYSFEKQMSAYNYIGGLGVC